MIDIDTYNIVKDYVNCTNLAEPKRGVLFTKFIKDTVSKKCKRMKRSYSHNYKTLIHLLEDFCRLNNAVLYTESIGEDFLDDFIVYLEERNLRKTYIKNLLSLIKAMVRKAAVHGYAVDSSYDNVDIDDEEISSIYLSMNEIIRIYYFVGLTKKQENIKNLFVIGCLTALRHSDLSTLSEKDFQNGYIVKITQKNGVKVVIPIHDLVKEIFEKYNGNLPNKISSQHFNKSIKTICKKIGINDKVNQTYTKGGRIITVTKEKWELVSTHTARRSGATNLMRTGRMTMDEVRQITGHTSEKSFRRYIRTTKEENAKQIAGDIFFRK